MPSCRVEDRRHCCDDHGRNRQHRESLVTDSKHESADLVLVDLVYAAFPHLFDREIPALGFSLDLVRHLVFAGDEEASPGFRWSALGTLVGSSRASMEPNRVVTRVLGQTLQEEAGMALRDQRSVTAEDGFEAFYQRWHSPIRRSLALALGDVGLADEAIDEAMTRALARWDVLSAYDHPEGWLYRVGLNWARGVFRKRRYELLSDLDTNSQTREDPVPDPDLIGAVGRLSLRLRAVVVARYYLDFSTAEVAEALDIPEGTVKSRLSRALDQLGRELGEVS